ncbi:cupin domain-containing protein [Methyloceanibacter sp. wino2]|uniref:cupin domain-containing protein n=1 Tax=Methyloceanibacter sp. wino2 TaxID=2170729 RepID=UPI000D3E7694|nr:cupin domain-containing protein [Methyloceanibacter sp. wino2]
MKTLVMAAMLSMFASPLFADDQQIERMVADAHKVFEEGTIDWKDEPILPKGAKSALVVGDPSKAGVFIAYLKFPANYVIPAHTHPFTEVVTVLKGKVGNGFGSRLDREKGELLDVGSSFMLPADHPHYLWNDEESVVLLIATGPWDIAYVDPGDDPRKAP